MQGGRIAGVTRGQLDVPDVLAVEKRLVHAVRRCVEPRLRGRRGEPEAMPQDVGGALGLLRLNEAGGPVRGLEEARLEPGRLGPVALDALGPDLDPPDDPLPGGQGWAGPGDEDAGVGVDPL